MPALKIYFAIIPSLVLFSCTSANQAESGEMIYTDIEDLRSQDTLFRIHGEAEYEYGLPCGYVNQQGDTLVPLGQYAVCITDTVTHFAKVIRQTDSGPEVIGLDRRGKRLFEIFWYDNGPDYVVEGLFRILRNGKIGYADESGRVVIDPQYACALPFSDGRAKVTFDCELGGEPTDEHRPIISETWFYIDRNGQTVK